MSAGLILKSGLFATLNRAAPAASAVAIKDGVFIPVGREQDVMPHVGPQTRTIDLKGHRVLPGLFDNHTHVIRAGLSFNMELRWDGVRSLADAMNMLKRQVAITPPPQWVRVIGGFTEHQFIAKRLPPVDELNAVAPDTPVFLLHLYDRAILNGAALRAVGYTKDMPNPPGGEIVRDGAGNPTGSSVRTYGGYAAWADKKSVQYAAFGSHAMSCGCANTCSIHGHNHAAAASRRLPVADRKAFWGALGCACWAV